MEFKTDRLYRKKWGIFTHYLYSIQNNPTHPACMGFTETSWDECVNSLDTELLAKQLDEIGAGYLFFTLMQGSQYFCAPNITFDSISGYKPGEACAHRDLPEELYKALSSKGIDLYLYYTGDGTYKDLVSGPKLGFMEPRKNVSFEFLEKWSAVLREYSIRYGKKVCGWWIDGTYSSFGYDEPRLKMLADAARVGNPDTLIGLNRGVEKRVMPYSMHEDFTCGEMNDFIDIPDDRFTGGKQWHTLIPLGVSPDGSEWNAWGCPGTKRSREYLRDYVEKVNDHGGVVTIDVSLRRDGTIDPVQLETLHFLDGLR